MFLFAYRLFDLISKVIKHRHLSFIKVLHIVMSMGMQSATPKREEDWWKNEEQNLHDRGAALQESGGPWCDV